MSAIAADERRGFGRSRVMLAATLERLNHQTPVRVINLSPEGATVAGRNLPRTNARVELLRNGRTMRGRIAWVRNEQAGIQFEQSCNVRDLLRQVAKPRPVYSERCRRPSLKTERVSKAERASIERCAAILGTIIAN